MKHNKKIHILETAEKLFNRFGVKKTAVDEIASKAQVAKGTIYNYFGNKEGIIAELINSKLLKFDSIMEKALDTFKDPVEKLKFIINERLRISIESPFLCENSLLFDELPVKEIKNQLDSRCGNLISEILSGKDKVKTNDNDTLIKTILFTIRGMDAYISEHIETATLNTFRGDIDCMTDLIFPGKQKET